MLTCPVPGALGVVSQLEVLDALDVILRQRAADVMRDAGIVDDALFRIRGDVEAGRALESACCGSAVRGGVGMRPTDAELFTSGRSATSADAAPEDEMTTHGPVVLRQIGDGERRQI